ncbi:hypothetical protein ACW2QC_00850 [Virgibacillus sp. FSP13]
MSKRLLKSTNLWLLVIFLVYSMFIIFQSKLDENGFLSSDSAHYLQLAQNFLNGDGMTTANYVNGMSTYFATWPVGYPVLIALMSFVSGLGVFWASKLVNILCLGACFILIKRLFKKRAVLVSMLFFVSTFTNLFVYTWSEVPFLLGMLWLVFGLVRYVETNKIGYVIHLLIASLFLFFMRYIGLIGAGIIGLVGFYYLFRKQWKPMIICWATGSLTILIAGMYLVVNYLKTGQLTGMERIPRVETASEFMTMLWEGLTTEFNLFSNTSHDFPTATIIVLLVGLVLFIRPKQVKALFQLRKDQLLLPGMFLFVGLVYFIAIVYMRWSAYFDPFNFRLLGPATFMIWFFICSWIAQLDKRNWVRWQDFLTIVLVIAFLHNIGFSSYEAMQSTGLTYEETVEQVQQTYEEIPTGSIVALEDYHARYLRPDIQFIKVHFRPYFADIESLQAFTHRITPNHAAGVYFQYRSLVGYQYDESFVDIMQAVNESGDEFVELGDVVE